MSPTGPSESTTRHGNGNSPRAWAYGGDHTRSAIAAHRLYHHAVLCDSTNQPQMARVMWQKYAEAARTVTRSTNLMKNTNQRYF